VFQDPAAAKIEKKKYAVSCAEARDRPRPTLSRISFLDEENDLISKGIYYTSEG
jgi:hypothetical protein